MVYASRVFLFYLEKPVSNLIQRADGANPVMFDLNDAMSLGADGPIWMLGWDKPCASSELLVAQTVGIKPDVEAVKMVALAMYTGTPVCLVGPQGCGKSTLLKAVLGITNWDVVITQASNTNEFIDLMGIRMPDGQWIENGPLNAYREGKVWMVEERDNFSPGTTTDLNAMLDRAPLRVPFLGQDAIPHPNHRVVGTANTIGNGDGLETFVSSQIQTPAANRRWVFHKMPYRKEDAEKASLLAIAPSLQDVPDIVEILVQFAAATRVQQEFPAFSTAELMMVGSMLQVANPVTYLGKVLEACYFVKLTAAAQAAAKELWTTVSGSKLEALMGGI